MLNTKSGSFHSPSYKDGMYLHDQNCDWLITASPGSHIKLQFPRFEVEHSPGCLNDWVEVYDGNTAQDASVFKECTRFGVSKVITSKGQYLLVRFHSDRANSFEGFKATFEVSGGEPSPTTPTGTTNATSTLTTTIAYSTPTGKWEKSFILLNIRANNYTV